MTPYLGSATASNVRVGDPSYLAAVILGILVWGGLFFRDARLRAAAFSQLAPTEDCSRAFERLA